MAMTELTVELAQTMVSSALAFARREGLKPVACAVLDDRGTLKAFAADDGTSLARERISQAKAHGALSLGTGSRSLYELADQQPHVVMALGAVVPTLAPVPGGVLVRDGDGGVIGAVGVSGETSENDERVAVAVIEAASLRADPGGAG
jgi:uncharacterized protein GlcG (DUF336 family)